MSEIREGFLCPICFEDLKSPTDLASHFQVVHQDEKNPLSQLRSVLDKTKKKIMGSGSDSATGEATGTLSNVSFGTPATGGIDLTCWPTQSIGERTSHLKLFQRERKTTIERQVVEYNKLLIRLEKLIKSGIYNSSSAVKTRKNVEKCVVPWEKDGAVKFCRNCEKKFSLTYRRHHCRLCGRVACEQCIDNLDMQLAVSLLKLDSKSLSSDAEVKSCTLCINLMTRQYKLSEAKNANTMLLQHYEKMTVSMKQADFLQPKFTKMADSVNSGECDVSFDSVMETRGKLLRFYEDIDATSKHIQVLCPGDKKPHIQLNKLQRSIRQYSTNYLTEKMFTLPSLPSKEKYQEIVKQRERKRPIKTPDDPVTQQIKNIRSYIAHARNKGKWDEVEMLEANLRELQSIKQS